MDYTPDKSSTGMDPNVAAGLAQLFTILGGIIFLILEKDSKFVKFYAFQGLFSGLCAFINIIPFLGQILWLVVVVFIIIALINAFQGKVYKIPLIGNLAAKQAGLE